MQRSERVILNLAAFLAVVCCGVLSLLAQSTVTTNPRITGEQAPGLTFGTGGATAQTNGTLGTPQFTPVSNTSINVEDVLMSQSVPGNTLLTNGQGVRITAGGVFAANANVKRAKLYFGATVLLDSSASVSAPNGTAWRFVAECVRTSATAQRCITFVSVAATSGWTISTAPAETLSGAVLIKVGGLAVTAATDITQQLLLVESIR